jgi:hypothetical protein
MLGEGQNGPADTTSSLRAQLTAGQPLEVAGYTLAPALAAAMDSVELALLAPPAVPVHWFEVVASEERPFPPAASRQIEVWQAAGVDMRSTLTAGPAFWSTQEISECRPLLDATTRAMADAN